MLIPVIKVRDKANNTEHIIGTNSHDALVVDKHKIEYYNLHNGCGTYGDDEYGYEFVFEENEWDVPYIQFVSLEEWVMLSMHDIDEQTKDLVFSYNMLAKIHQKAAQRARENAGIVMDTGGDILE